MYTLLAPVVWAIAQRHYILSWAVSLVFPDTATGIFWTSPVPPLGWIGETATSACARWIVPILPVSLWQCQCRWGPASAWGDDLQIEKEISFGVYQAVAQTAGQLPTSLSGDLLPIDNISGLGRAELGEVLIPARDAETDEGVPGEGLPNRCGRPPMASNIADYREKDVDD